MAPAKPATVLVDVTFTLTDRGGMERYVDGVLPELAKYALDLAIVCQRPDIDRYTALVPEARIIPGPASIVHRPARLAWEQTGLPALAAEAGANLIHGPYYTIPLRIHCPVISTVHDMSFFSHPYAYDKIRGALFRSAIKTAAHRARRIITPSSETRNLLMSQLGVTSERIDVIFPGVDRRLFHQPDDQEKQQARSWLGIGDQPYIAFFGLQRPRRTITNLIKAWSAACVERANPPVLVIAGAADDTSDIEAAAATIASHLTLLRPGYLPDRVLSGFLGQAICVGCPGHGEDSALTILETMACGTPVITGDSPVSREIGGEAVTYVGTTPAAATAALSRLLDDPAWRSHSSDIGLERVRNFTWERSAAMHYSTYMKAIEESNHYES